MKEWHPFISPFVLSASSELGVDLSKDEYSGAGSVHGSTSSPRTDGGRGHRTPSVAQSDPFVLSASSEFGVDLSKDGLIHFPFPL